LFIEIRFLWGGGFFEGEKKMANKILKVGDPDARYKTIIIAMNKVFGIKVKAAFTAEYEISKNKVAVFFPIAKWEEHGGWIRIIKEKPCINIPYFKGSTIKGITQYALTNEPILTKRSPNTEYALLVKRVAIGPNSNYEFIGIFSRTESKKDKFSTYFKQTGIKLDIKKWKGEVKS
jgi:hypothetical protein